MVRRLSMIFVVVLFVVGALMSQTSMAQTTHTVGDSTGWRIPPGGAATYTTWASQQTFTVGDVLVFNFVSGTHDVAKVTKDAFEACTTSNPISLVTTAPADITLTAAGEHYFICSFGAHCDAGQKLSITVSNASTVTPPTSITSPPTTLPSSASTMSSMGISVILLSFAIRALFH